MLDYLQIAGSERDTPTGDRRLGRLNPQTVIQATVQIRRQQADDLSSFVRTLAVQPLEKRQHLNREEFTARYGAAPSDIKLVRQFARQQGLETVEDMSAKRSGSNARAHRTLELRGTATAFSQAFKVKLFRFRGSEGIYRGYEGPIQVPGNLHSIVQNIFGLDTRPQAKPRLRRMVSLGGLATAAGQSYTPNQVARMYNFPVGSTGKGQVIAIIELGGGYKRRDLKKYFQDLGIPMPAVKAVAVAGGTNAPKGNPNSADGEVMLDIEVAGAVAPGAQIVVYFAKNTNRGFFRAVNTAINDNSNKPTILSVSWGGAEGSWRSADMDSMDQAFQAAAAMGVSVFVAAGDGGSSDGVSPGNIAHVDFPASSPFATSCGGTRLESSDGQTITNEVVWNDGPQGGGTGGGISAYFPVPIYQAGLTLPSSLNPGGGPGRAVPDVAGNADPWSGYKIRVDSQDLTIGGTSAVAPLWAGLAALLNEGLGREIGFLNPVLYKQVKSVPGTLRDILSGNNDTTQLVGGYSAGPSYNACTGLGTPNGQAILDAMD